MFQLLLKKISRFLMPIIISPVGMITGILHIKGTHAVSKAKVEKSSLWRDLCSVIISDA